MSFSLGSLSNLQLWLDAQQLTGTNGAPVTSWPDLSPNAAFLTQGISGEIPAYNSTGINGKPTVEFSPSIPNKAMRLITPTLAGTQPASGKLTLFAVFSNASNSVYASGPYSSGSSPYPSPVLIVSAESDGPSGWVLGGDNAPQAWSAGVGNAMQDPPLVNFQVTSNTPTLVEVTFDGTTLTAWKNGDLLGFDTIWTPNPPAFPLQTLCLGQWYGDATAFYGQIGEIIFYDRTLTDFERQQIEQYVSTRWRITIAPSRVTESVEPPKSTFIQAFRHLGDINVPRDVGRRRKQVQDVMLRVGTPVLIKQVYTIADVEKGIAQRSPNYARWAGQGRHNDPFSHGIGFCSIETSDNEWIAPDGHIVIADSSPGSDYTPAPKYRGYGPSYLTFVIQPDAPIDTFKVDPTGAFIKTQDATGQAPWFPTMHDMDLMINVNLDSEGNIVNTEERYQLKTVTPISVRGLNKRGQREVGAGVDSFGGNRYTLNQTFHTSLVPPNDEAYSVETDR